MQTWIALSEILRNLALAVAAGIGAFLAWRKLGPETSQVELARRAHVTELFNRAAGQLGDERLEVRLAAIYVLREVGRDFPDLSRPVFELLQIHLQGKQAEYGDREPPVDIRVLIEVLSRGRKGH
ncbi:hypothetical protein [Aureimonas glaciei]|jgi:hypothetical protein|uniref:Uncharacterized protein n=1 Tax=Aureimonas glaciei TaxID=1776957 RepID=A0A916V169_9HYPH|nr:hypothetical protein [Aureimonas glaciei]GGD01513.1 hypothetical protein GCM10011335_00100 [Aureimonas glaciei]